MLADIAYPEKELIGDKLGSYNKKFVEKWGKLLVKAFGENAQNVHHMEAKKYLGLLQQAN